MKLCKVISVAFLIQNLMPGIIPLSVYENMVLLSGDCHNIYFLVICQENCLAHVTVQLFSNNSQTAIKSKYGQCTSEDVFFSYSDSFPISCRQNYSISVFIPHTPCFPNSSITLRPPAAIFGNGSCSGKADNRQSITFSENCQGQSLPHSADIGRGVYFYPVIASVPVVLIIGICLFYRRLIHPHRSVPPFSDNYSNREYTIARCMII